jgi:HEAT repeat protein
VLSRARLLNWTEEFEGSLEKRIASESHPDQRLHLQLLRNLSSLSPQSLPDGLARVRGCLDSLSEDSPGESNVLTLILLLFQLNPADAVLAVDLVHQRGLEDLPEEALSLLLQFFERHGSAAHAELIEPFCRHPNPQVLLAAVETLEKLRPDSLKSQLISLLANSNAAIYSRAVRLLHRYDPNAALNHFSAVLQSGTPAEKSALLSHAFFFPFDHIRTALLSLVRMESDGELLRKVGLVLQVNPDQGLLIKLVSILEGSPAEKKAVLKEIILGSITNLSQSGIHKGTPRDILDELRQDFLKKKREESLRISAMKLSSENPTERFLALRALVPFLKEHDPEARKIFDSGRAREEHPELRQYMSHLQDLPQTVLPTGGSGKNPESRHQLEEAFFQGNLSQKILVLDTMAERAPDRFVSFLEQQLAHPIPEVVLTAMDLLARISRESFSRHFRTLFYHGNTLIESLALTLHFVEAPENASQALAEKLWSSHRDQRAWAIGEAAPYESALLTEALINLFFQEPDPENLEKLSHLLLEHMHPDLFRNMADRFCRHPAGTRECLQLFFQEAVRKLAERNPEVAKDHWQAMLTPKPEESASDEAFSVSRIQTLRQAETIDSPEDSRQTSLEPDTRLLQPTFSDLESDEPIDRYLKLQLHPDGTSAKRETASGREITPADGDDLERFLADLNSSFPNHASHSLRPAQALKALEQELGELPSRPLQACCILKNLPAKAGPLAAAILRRADWTRARVAAVPILLQFFRSFGIPEDCRAIAGFLAHPDPRVVFTAIEALARVKPEELRPHFPELLCSKYPAIRSQTIRLLSRHDLPAAREHLQEALTSADKPAISWALCHAYFFPFTEIRHDLLEVTARESDPAILKLAGLVFKVNPELVSVRALVDISLHAHPAKKAILDHLILEILAGPSLRGAGSETPDALLATLVAENRQQKHDQKIEQAARNLESPEVRVREASIRRLMRHADDKVGANALRRHRSREQDPALRDLLTAFFAASPGRVSAWELYLSLPENEKTVFLSELKESDFIPLRTKVRERLLQAPTTETGALLEVLARFADSDDKSILERFLHHGTPAHAVLALTALARLFPESFSERLPGFCRHPSPEVRLGALVALFPADEQTALSFLHQWLHSTNPDERLGAVRTAGELPFASVRADLLSLLQSETTPEIFAELLFLLETHLDLDILRSLVARTAKPPAPDAWATITETWAKKLVNTPGTEEKTPQDLLTRCRLDVLAHKEQAGREIPGYALNKLQKRLTRPPGADPSTGSNWTEIILKALSALKSQPPATWGGLALLTLGLMLFSFFPEATPPPKSPEIMPHPTTLTAKSPYVVQETVQMSGFIKLLLPDGFLLEVPGTKSFVTVQCPEKRFNPGQKFDGTVSVYLRAPRQIKGRLVTGTVQ